MSRKEESFFELFFLSVNAWISDVKIWKESKELPVWDWTPASIMILYDKLMQILISTFE